MKPVPYWLTGIFVLQIAVAGLLYFQSEQQQTGLKPSSLLNLATAEVKHIRLTEGDQVVQLDRSGEEWRLSVSGEGVDSPIEPLPASDSLVRKLLITLEGLTTSWPVAQTESAQQRFEVAETLFQRKLELETDVGTQTLYLGTSPGFRKLHVRLQDQDAIYALELSLHEMPAELDYWLDKRLLASDTLTAIEGTNVKLVLNEVTNEEVVSKDAVDNTATESGGAPEAKYSALWQFEDAAGEVDQDQAHSIANRLQNLHVKGVVTTAVPETLEWVSLKAQAKTTKYEWKLAQQEDQRYIQRADKPGIFTLDKATYDALTAVRRTQLAKTEKVEAPENLVESNL